LTRRGTMNFSNLITPINLFIWWHKIGSPDCLLKTQLSAIMKIIV
jgi:hypothetical protein